ncbi:uncharacterized protein LOC144425689 isoform X2 [Styela clava]
MQCVIGFILLVLGLISCSTASTCADGSVINQGSGTIMSPSNQNECNNKICSWKFGLNKDHHYTKNANLLVLNVSKISGVGNNDLLWIEIEGLDYRKIDFDLNRTVILSYYISNDCLDEMKTLQWIPRQVQDDVILKFKCEPSRFQFTIDYALYPCENTCNDISIPNYNGTIQSPKKKSECGQRVCSWFFNLTASQNNTSKILILNFTGTTSAKDREMLWMETPDGYNMNINFSSNAKFVCMIYYMSYDGGLGKTNCVTQKLDTPKIYLKYMCEPSLIQFRLEYTTLVQQIYVMNENVLLLIILSVLAGSFCIVIVYVLTEIKKLNSRQQPRQNGLPNSNEEPGNTSHNDNLTTSAPMPSDLPTMNLPKLQPWSDVSSENIYEEIEEWDATFEEKIKLLEEIFEVEKVTEKYAVQIFH